MAGRHGKDDVRGSIPRVGSKSTASFLAVFLFKKDRYLIIYVLHDSVKH